MTVHVKNLLIGFAVCAIRIVYAASEDDILSCLELFNPEEVEKMCCQNLESFDKIGEDTKECIMGDRDEWRCEDFECVLKKNGMMNGSKIDEDGVNKHLDDLEKKSPEEKTALNKVRQQCLNGKYEDYPPDDACAAMKFYVCTYINIYLECDSWKNTEACSQMGEHAQKCRSALAE